MRQAMYIIFRVTLYTKIVRAAFRGKWVWDDVYFPFYIYWHKSPYCYWTESNGMLFFYCAWRKLLRSGELLWQYCETFWLLQDVINRAIVYIMKLFICHHIDGRVGDTDTIYFILTLTFTMKFSKTERSCYVKREKVF